MSVHNRAAQSTPDANQSDVRDWYEAEYCQVLDLHKLGGGCPDLLVRVPTRAGAILQLVEVKTLDGVLAPSQKTFHRDWGATVVVVRTRADVSAHVEAVRERFKK